MQAPQYNQTGEESGAVELPEHIFSAPWNSSLVHQVVVGMQANARTPIAHTKDRSDVSGGGKKPWRQKGTGRARHGSIRSPLWRGGGVTFGPRNDKDYTKKLNKKMRAKALYSVLSQKLRDKEILFIDTLQFESPKTKEAKRILTALAGIAGFEDLSTKKHNAAVIAFGHKDDITQKSFDNFGNIKTKEIRNINPVDLLHYKYVIITRPKEAIEFLEGRAR